MCLASGIYFTENKWQAFRVHQGCFFVFFEGELFFSGRVHFLEKLKVQNCFSYSNSQKPLFSVGCMPSMGSAAQKKAHILFITNAIKKYHEKSIHI